MTTKISAELQARLDTLQKVHPDDYDYEYQGNRSHTTDAAVKSFKELWLALLNGNPNSLSGGEPSACPSPDGGIHFEWGRIMKPFI